MITFEQLTEEQRAAFSDARELLSTSRGGHIADVPEPRLWLSTVKGVRRRVKVEVLRWQTHYYVHIEEADDYVWDARGRVWRQLWEHRPSAGREFRARYALARFVEPYIQRTLKENFKRSTHRIVRDQPSKRHWVYSRTGD